MDKTHFMKLICTFCIVAVCLCYGCEKKKNAASATTIGTTIMPPVDSPRVVVTFPYTDTFYGVWSDTFDAHADRFYGDTSFATIAYITHVDSTTIHVNGNITMFVREFNVLGSDDWGYAFKYSDTVSFYNILGVDSTIVGYDSVMTFSFTRDSLYMTKYAGARSYYENGSFAGKGNVHQH